MPDMQPIANQINPPDASRGLNLLSNILGLQQQKLAIQSGQAGLVGAQQKAREIQAGSKLLADPVGSGLIDEDGNPTKDAYSIIKRAMPTTGDEQYNNLVSAAKVKVDLKAASQNLSANELSYTGSRLAGVVADPNSHTSDVLSTIEDISNQFKGTPQEKDYDKLTGALRTAVNQVDQKHGMDGVRATVNNLSRGMIGNAGITGAGGVGTPTIGTIDRGGSIQPGVIAPALQGGGFTPSGQPIAKTIPPQVITSPTNQGPAIVGPSGRVTPIGGSGGVGGGGGNPWQPPPDLKTIQSQIEATRQAGDQVPVNRDINNRILRLADQATTGKGTDWLHQAAATAGLPSGSSYQELGAFLDRQAALAQQSMGMPLTNAGLESAKQFTGNTQYDNQVIKDKTKFVDALNTATGAYRAGLDRVVGTGQNPNYAAYQQYRSSWAQNFDPNVFAYENAFKRGDKAELARIEADEGRKGMAILQQKRRALMGLVNGQ